MGRPALLRDPSTSESVMRDWTRRQFLVGTASGLGVLAVPAFLVRTRLARGSPLPVPPTTVASAAADLDATYFATEFGVDGATIGRVMRAALTSGGDFADLYFQHRLSSSLALEDGRIHRASTTVDLGVGIRVVVGEQTGYAYTEEFDETSMKRAAATAASIARSARSIAPESYAIAGHPQYYPIETAWTEVGVDRKIPLLETLDRDIARRDPRISKASIFFADSTSRIMVVTSDGLAVEDDQPSGYLRATVVAEQDGRRERNGFAISGRRDVHSFGADTLDEIARTAVERTLLLFEAVQPPAGEMPVVLGPGESGVLLHEAIGHGMEADFNRKQISIYADMIGRPIAGEQVTIIDDGTVANARGSINVDDEGEPGQRTVLVENGILRTYLHDRISAGHYRVPRTGSGRRESFRYPPLPRMRTTYMTDGPHDPEEIIRSVKKGVYAANFTNGQVQIGAGDFSFYVSSGFLIEDGRLTAPVKDINMIGNGPNVLENVSMVGDDMALSRGGWNCGKGGQSVPVSLGQPTIRVDSGVTIGGIEQG
jgi:TldD protein